MRRLVCIERRLWHVVWIILLGLFRTYFFNFCVHCGCLSVGSWRRFLLILTPSRSHGHKPAAFSFCRLFASLRSTTDHFKFFGGKFETVRFAARHEVILHDQLAPILALILSPLLLYVFRILYLILLILLGYGITVVLSLIVVRHRPFTLRRMILLFGVISAV